MTGTSPERILVIVDDCGPADAIRWSGCVGALREAYPAAEMVLLAGEAAAPVFARSASVDRVVVSRLYARRPGTVRRLRIAKLRCLLALLPRLRTGYDLVVTVGWGSTLLNLLGRVCGRRRVGYANALPGLLSSRLGGWDADGDTTAQLRRLLAELGVIPGDLPPLLPVSDGVDAATVDRLLDEHRLAGRDLAVLHPGSDWACQQGLPEHWARLADGLAEDAGLVPVFTGLGDEAPLIEAVRGRMRGASVSLAGRTTLGELRSLLARVRVCVCVDSVTQDLARGVGTPAVVIAGASRVEGVSDSIIVVDRTAGDVKEAIRASKEARSMNGGCLDYGCPLWGLRSVAVDDVRTAIRALGVARG